METKSKAEEYLDSLYFGKPAPTGEDSIVISRKELDEYSRLYHAETLEKAGSELPKDILTFHPDAVSQGMTVMKRNPNGEYVKYEAFCDYRDNVTTLIAKYKAELAEANNGNVFEKYKQATSMFKKKQDELAKCQQENERLKDLLNEADKELSAILGSPHSMTGKIKALTTPNAE